MFETSDLFEASKFEAVVNTLSVISNHPECIAKGWDSFSVVPNKKRYGENIGWDLLILSCLFCPSVQYY